MAIAGVVEKWCGRCKCWTKAGKAHLTNDHVVRPKKAGGIANANASRDAVDESDSDSEGSLVQMVRGFVGAITTTNTVCNTDDAEIECAAKKFYAGLRAGRGEALGKKELDNFKYCSACDTYSMHGRYGLVHDHHTILKAVDSITSTVD
jgi:hypothetical protein